MANDINIVVEASLGDSLLKLGLAKKAISDVGHSGETTTGHLKDFNRSMDDATVASAKAGEAIIRAGRLIDETDGFMSNTTRDANLFERALGGIADVFTGGGGGGIIGLLGTAVPLFGGLSVPLAALPVLIFAVVTAAYALVTALGTLIAIVADLVAPLTLVTGLLGGLALGFGIAVKRALEGGPKFAKFKDAVSGLGDQFKKTSTDLAVAFLPVLMRLAHAASMALTFIDKLAHEPLGRAMKDMATQGVQMINQFVEQAAHLVAKPIRLAFQIAFGTGKGGHEFASAVDNWWHQFTGFLFGYTQTHRANLPLEHQFAPITQQHVDGIFQPLIDWFNRHHFTKQGQEIADDIFLGLKKISGPLSNWLSVLFLTSALKTGPAAGHLLAYGINHGLRDLDAYLLRLWNRFLAAAEKYGRLAGRALLAAMIVIAPKIVQTLSNAWNDIRGDASGVWHAIGAIARNVVSANAELVRSALSSAWHSVRSAAVSIWGSIRSAASSAISSIASKISGSLSSAWNSVKAAAEHAWNYIKGLFSQTLSLHISVPHISLPNIPGIAGGGTIIQSGVALVGEQGPELVHLPRGARVVPNHHLVSGAGGVTVNIFAADLSTPEAQRRVAHTVGRHLLNEWGQASGTV